MSGVADVQRVLEAVRIESPTRFSIAGEEVEIAGDVSLVGALRDRMYGLYCGYGNGQQGGVDDLADRALVQALSAANCGRGTWEPGWRVIGPADDGRVPLRKDGLTLWVTPGQYRTGAPGSEHERAAPPRPGASCRVRVPKELREGMAGFYFAIGDGDEREARGTSDADERIVRLYWHVAVAGAPALIGALTRVLNPLRVPFRAKVISFGAGYPRRDAGVLYVERRSYPRVAAALPEIHAAVAAHLGDAVPLFTRRLAAGLGLAEDPGGDESFGQHRCGLVATALWTAHVAGIPDGARLAHVCTTIAAQGHDVERLYLEPGSADAYGALGTIEDPRAFAAAARHGARVRADQRELRARRKQERRWRKLNRRT